MKKHYLLLCTIFFVCYSISLNAQNPFAIQFANAYAQFPDVPKGMLEAVAWSNTRMTHLDASEPEGCSGYPKAWGVMGLTWDGKNYFRENLLTISELSEFTPQQIIQSPENSILAYAKAYQILVQRKKRNLTSLHEFSTRLHEAVLAELSEIPDSGTVNQFAFETQVYQIFRFLNDPEMAAKYGFQVYNIQLEKHFGSNFHILSASKIIFDENGIRNANGQYYAHQELQTRSTEYGPAIWTPAPSCNYSSRSGTPISAITIHTIQGTYAGAISWAQNCASSVSYHYVLRSSDGQVTQMVAEANKAWHVGSENPYTIGYEHEGYVSQNTWYTSAMYNASAALSRDICNSGYGINPLRTFFGAATTGTNVIGNCTKIKGHQHYPNQTHTDPGIYWNWELYYQLINNAPSQTTLSATSGTLYDSGGSSGNYSNDERYFRLIQPTGASSVTLNFSAFSTEANWDYLYIYDGATNAAPLIGVYTGTNSPGTITSTGGSLLLEFRSDCATTTSGWIANWTSTVSVPPTVDITAPTTQVSVPNTWVTQNFTATFSDADNTGGSGLEKAFYQIIDFDGSDWRANANNGFFSDNFDLANIHADWTEMSGTWNIVNGELVQSDESNGNTNLYAFLDQSLSNRYLYHWSGKMEGTGTNRRAGLHYFCDDPTLSNRGNSYFVWFRLDNDKVQIYEVVNDVFTLMDEVSFNFNAGQWYDYKIIYDRITGKHQVFIDNVLVQTWTDTTPYASGDYISFRSGNCIYAVNNLKVYRSRFPSLTVSVGASNDLRYQNTNPSTPAGRIKSMVIDSAGNLSSIAYQDVNVDWTAPDDIATVNDGPATDISITTNNTELQANWTNSFDQHSDVARYWYAIGTSPGATDVLNWTDNYWYDTVRVTGLSLSYGTTYYFSVKAENGAGLMSNVTSSNGQLLQAPSNPPIANFISGNTFVCAGSGITFQNISLDASTYQWIFQGGLPPTSTAVNPSVIFSTSGTYDVTLIASGPGGNDTILQNISIDVSQPITAAFDATDTLVYLPNAFVGFTNNSTNANGFAWNFGDGQSSNGTNPWNIYTAPGDYPVTLIAVNNACPADTASRIIHVGNANGILEENPSLYHVYWNNNVLTFSSDLKEPTLLNISIFDLSGKLIESFVKSVSSGKQSYSIATSSLASGVYLISIFGNNSQWQQRIHIP
jgi:PKD repeat protein/N-acetyl-anhydromuramyl-L-alanine amidase AmpD